MIDPSLKKYYIIAISLFVVVSLIFTYLLVTYAQRKGGLESPVTDTQQQEDTASTFEQGWWLKPQTFGMFNYYDDTDYQRLTDTNSTVNGYRLVSSLDEFNYEEDIQSAQEKGIKYVVGLVFQITELGDDGNPTCRSYEEIKSNEIEKGKAIVDLGVDGLAVIHPFGDHFFMENQQSCLCADSSTKSELDCATDFYKEFREEIKSYAQEKGIDDFPIGVANHGEWMIPWTVDMLPYSDLTFSNIDEIENGSHAYLYKLHFVATDSPLIAAPMDASFGWLVENSQKGEDLIQIKMAEAYVQKGAFQDQYIAGLSPSCVEEENQGDFDESCWLAKSVDVASVRRINDFYLANKEIFDINASSLASIAVLFSAKSITGTEDQHWSQFRQITKAMDAAHIQYDIIFSEDSTITSNTVDLETLEKYEMIILPNNEEVDENLVNVFSEYLGNEGKLFALDDLDSELASLESQYPFGFSHLLEMNGTEEFISQLNLKVQTIVEDTLPSDVDIQVWSIPSSDGTPANKLIVHLINYEFDVQQGVVDKENIDISINIGDVFEPTAVQLLSPHLDEAQILDFDFTEGVLQFNVANLKVWDVVVVE